MVKFQNLMFIIEGGGRLSSEEARVLPVKSPHNRFSLAFSCKEINFMTIILVKLNLLDVLSSFYAINGSGL